MEKIRDFRDLIVCQRAYKLFLDSAEIQRNYLNINSKYPFERGRLKVMP